MARLPESLAMTLRSACAATALFCAGSPAHADLQLCNRTSYVLDLAIGLETKNAAATRGWFRIDPGECRVVLNGTIEAENIYVHTRANAAYHDAPLQPTHHAKLCIAEGNFVIAGARKCPAGGQRLADFTAVQPSTNADGMTEAAVGEEAGYTAEQARLAAIQRLLTAIGYDAEPIDGIEGKKTEAALAQFLKERRLAPGAADAKDFLDTLLAAARAAGEGGFAWCNDTSHVVMAALGSEEKGTIVTRGWYRVIPGRCLRPDVSGNPRRVYSFAEAIDDDGRVVQRADKSLAWGGLVTLCTRALQFEIVEQRDCVERGLAAAGFAAVDLAGRGATVRFKE